MNFLVYLLLVAVMLAPGTLVAKALPARGMRIGLGTIVFLAAVVALTWIVVPVTGWSAGLATAAAVGVVMCAGLFALRSRSHQRHHPQWPSARDLAFLALVVAGFGAVPLLTPVPLDTDAQGFGYLALMLREGGDHTTLAPWHPEIEYLYSPAYPGVIAHVSAYLSPGIHVLQMAFSAATAAIFVWAAYDLGCELGDQRLGRAMMLAALGGTGLITAFMDSHYTALLALVFSLGFLAFVFRFLASRAWTDAALAAICLAGVPLSQPDTTIALITGYAPWLIAVLWARPRPDRRAWLGIAVIIPLMALALVTPWLISLRDLLGSSIESPFEVALSHWRTLIFMHGGVVVVLALMGAVVPARRRTPAQLLMVVWLAAIIEFSMLGLAERAIPAVMEPLLKYDYPFSLAWHGPIIPYMVLGGSGLLWLADRLHADRLVARLAYPLTALAGGALVIVIIAFGPLLDASKDAGANFFGAFSSAADVDAMRWLRDHTPDTARILNHPGPHEGDWVPIISERDTIFFRPQPFFRGTEQADAEQAAFRAFWRDPANPDHRALFVKAGVQYVIVPQVFVDPGAFGEMIRWRSPLDEAAGYNSSAVEDVPYLRLVYENDGAQVFEVVGK